MCREPGQATLLPSPEPPDLVEELDEELLGLEESELDDDDEEDELDESVEDVESLLLLDDDDDEELFEPERLSVL